MLDTIQFGAFHVHTNEVDGLHPYLVNKMVDLWKLSKHPQGMGDLPIFFKKHNPTNVLLMQDGQGNYLTCSSTLDRLEPWYHNEQFGIWGSYDELYRISESMSEAEQEWFWGLPVPQYVNIN